MTIKELYEWACENYIEDYEIYARTCDGYYLQVNSDDIDIDNIDKEISIL